MGRQADTHIECFTLRVDEVKMLSMFRRLTPPDRSGVVKALARVVANRVRPSGTIKTGGGPA